MTVDVAYDYRSWIIVAIALVACWPLAQAMRHDRLHPLAAYLLFVSVLALVAAPVFWVLLLIVGTVAGPAGLQGAVPAAIIILASLVPGLVVARWVIRRPQQRRMPK